MNRNQQEELKPRTQFREKIRFLHREISVSCANYKYEKVTLSYLNSSPLSVKWSLTGGHKQNKISNFSLKSVRGRLREVRPGSNAVLHISRIPFVLPN